MWWSWTKPAGGSPVGGNSAWLWVATNETVTVYNVAEGRGFDQACDLVSEDYTGTIVRDGWAPYRRYDHAEHQTFLAHLLRRCHHLIEDLPGWARSTPRQVADLLHEALNARDLDPAERAEVAVDLAERIELLGEQPHPHDECPKLVAHLTNEAPALFSFLADPAVDATNWRAEQAIRPAVVNRKTWGGNRTWCGAATQGRITSVLRTAHQHGIDAIDYLWSARPRPRPRSHPPAAALTSPRRTSNPATRRVAPGQPFTQIHLGAPRYPSTLRTRRVGGSGLLDGGCRQAT